jgi:hypothetical protein
LIFYNFKFYFFIFPFLSICQGEDGIEKVKVEVSVKKGSDIRPIGCDVPAGQVGRGGRGGKEGGKEGGERKHRKRLYIVKLNNFNIRQF